MNLAFVLALSLVGSTPRLVVGDPVAHGVGPRDVQAAAEQVRQAVRATELDLVEGCQGLDCARQDRCDYFLSTRLEGRAAEIQARIELIDVRSKEVLATRLNVAPLLYGTAILDLPLMVAEVLAVLTAPSRYPSGGSPVVVVNEPVDAPVVKPAPVETVPIRPVLRAPLSEPVPREGIWVGHCVSDPELGADVYLDPDDWARYRRYRQRTEDPLTVSRWIEEQNHESWALNFVWITPPVLLALGLLTDSSKLTVLGGGTMPVAAIAAIADAVDAGSVDRCRPPHP